MTKTPSSVSLRTSVTEDGGFEWVDCSRHEDPMRESTRRSDLAEANECPDMVIALAIEEIALATLLVRNEVRRLAAESRHIAGRAPQAAPRTL